MNLIKSSGINMSFNPKQKDKKKYIGGNTFVNGKKGGPKGVTPNVNGKDMFGMANPIMVSGTTGNLPFILNIVEYANDAAAGAAGLITGDLYRTGSALQLKL